MAAPDDGERIQADDGGEWTCLCRNQAHLDGFTTCTPVGRLVEPVVGGEWDGRHYRCHRCGRIIDQETLRVSGTADSAASAAQAEATRTYRVAMYAAGDQPATRGGLEECVVTVADGDDEHALREDALRLGAVRLHPQWKLHDLAAEPLPGLYRLDFATGDGTSLRYLGAATRLAR
jgi:hypothetical protein